jgi:hypothetical protein
MSHEYVSNRPVWHLFLAPVFHPKVLSQMAFRPDSGWVACR